MHAYGRSQSVGNGKGKPLIRGKLRVEESGSVSLTNPLSKPHGWSV